MSDDDAPMMVLYDKHVGLTKAERHALVKVRWHGLGVRELADRSDRSPGTVGNLLSRAESKLEAAGYGEVVPT